MRKIDEDKTEYKRRLKRANTIPGQGIRCINKWSAEASYMDLYDPEDEYDDDYETSNEPKESKL